MHYEHQALMASWRRTLIWAVLRGVYFSYVVTRLDQGYASTHSREVNLTPLHVSWVLQPVCLCECTGWRETRECPEVSKGDNKGVGIKAAREKGKELDRFSLKRDK